MSNLRHFRHPHLDHPPIPLLRVRIQTLHLRGSHPDTTEITNIYRICRKLVFQACPEQRALATKQNSSRAHLGQTNLWLKEPQHTHMSTNTIMTHIFRTTTYHVPPPWLDLSLPPVLSRRVIHRRTLTMPLGNLGDQNLNVFRPGMPQVAVRRLM